jgi:hypothetical protein
LKTRKVKLLNINGQQEAMEVKCSKHNKKRQRVYDEKSKEVFEICWEKGIIQA